MTGPEWVPGAVRLDPRGTGGTTHQTEAGGPHMVWHTTECPSGPRGEDEDYWFNAMHRTLISKMAEPTLLWDPITDKLGQYFPLSQTARALQNDGGHQTNRTGNPCIQIEVVGYASRPFTRDWQPGKNFLALGKALAEHGVPWVWPSGNPPPGNSDERGDVYYVKGGHYGHSQVPGNSHWDPGQIDVGALFKALGQKTSGSTDPLDPGSAVSKIWPAWRKFPGYGKFKAYDYLLVTAALTVNGYAHMTKNTVNRTWTAQDVSALEKFKTERKISEGGVGPKTWEALGTMTKKAPAFDPKAFELGTRSMDSLKLQALMILQGFAGPLNMKAKQLWTPKAAKAVRRFQQSEHKLAVQADGVPGPLTWKKAWQDNT